MKKIQLLVWGTLFLLALDSCSKDKLEPNNSKKEAVKTKQSASDQPQTQPAQPPSSCPHAAGNTPRG
jgi:hypothetical protein